MWVFGYGSLMWDAWETQYGCVRKVTAILSGFRRVFNKASVQNWGTPERPCPTLNIADDESGECKGLAFEFADEKRDSVIAALKDREGKNFELSEREIVLDGGERVRAVTLRYLGRNLIGNKSLTERAEMVRVTVGTVGNCADYVKGIADKLAELGINDPAVQEFAEAVQDRNRPNA